jgi:hypothetical protein
VAEFVEHGGDVVEAEQRRLARRRLGEVGDVVDTGLVPSSFDWLTKFDIQAPPDLVVALEIVEIHEAELGAVLVVDLEHADVRLIDRDVLPLLEGDAVELVGGVEDAVLEHRLSSK